MIELLSIDLSNFCSKQCSFCYNHSTREGNTVWLPDEVIRFASDCVSHGIKAVSLGGGEPFEYEGVFEVIDALFTRCYLSVTSNGLPLRCLGATLSAQARQNPSYNSSTRQQGRGCEGGAAFAENIGNRH